MPRRNRQCHRTRHCFYISRKRKISRLARFSLLSDTVLLTLSTQSDRVEREPTTQVCDHSMKQDGSSKARHSMQNKYINSGLVAQLMPYG